jgi:outer membrane lipopolysaccharide assembly protein LptE/RlpB
MTKPGMFRICRDALSYLFLFLLVALQGCGYSLHSHASLPFREIAIDTIENRTVEPGLQDMLHRAVVEEFMRQGISVSPSARQRLSAVIQNFDMPSLSEKGGFSREYRIIINVDFAVTDENGQKRYIKNVGSPFMVPFAGSDDLGRLLATKRMAQEEALRDVAQQLTGLLIYK